MKKLILFFITTFVLTNFTSQSKAYEPDDTAELIIGECLNFSMNIDPTKGHTGIPKAPVLKPRVIQDGHALLLISGCDESTLVILNEFGNEVFSAYITEGCSSINIPAAITGSCEIHIHRGIYCFYTQIEL